jgi:ribosomal protein L7/L12
LKKQEIIREQSLATLNDIIATYNKNGYVIMPGSLQLITSTKTNFWIVILEKELVINSSVSEKKHFDFTNLVLNTLINTNNNKILTIKAVREATRVTDSEGQTLSVMGLKEAKDMVEDIICKANQRRWKEIYG